MLRKTISTILLATMGFVAANAQQGPRPSAPEVDYQFSVVKENYVTPVKNQASSGTCWSYSTISFLESEAIKNGAPKNIDLAEMLPVYMGYRDKAEKFIRLDGFLNYEQGSSFGDVIY
ncbi:MAG: aminopeptidase, partial [Bacteroidales bacterium]|nr:aminopeptidase [Bacteroidales bacterium]